MWAHFYSIVWAQIWANAHSVEHLAYTIVLLYTWKKSILCRKVELDRLPGHTHFSIRLRHGEVYRCQDGWYAVQAVAKAWRDVTAMVNMGSGIWVRVSSTSRACHHHQTSLLSSQVTSRPVDVMAIFAAIDKKDSSEGRAARAEYSIWAL
jgi:hypothetical protein